MGVMGVMEIINRGQSGDTGQQHSFYGGYSVFFVQANKLMRA